MSQPAAPENLNIRVFTQSGSEGDIGERLGEVRFTPENGHPKPGRDMP